MSYEQVLRQEIAESQAFWADYRGDGSIVDTLRWARFRRWSEHERHSGRGQPEVASQPEVAPIIPLTNMRDRQFETTRTTQAKTSVIYLPARLAAREALYATWDRGGT